MSEWAFAQLGLYHPTTLPEACFRSTCVTRVFRRLNALDRSLV